MTDFLCICCLNNAVTTTQAWSKTKASVMVTGTALCAACGLGRCNHAEKFITAGAPNQEKL